MKAYVINLDRTPERLAAFNSRLATFGDAWPLPQPQRRRAIDGQLCPPPDWWCAGPGAWGIYQTTVSLIADLLLDRVAADDAVWLFEDDAVFVDGFPDAFAQFWAAVPDDWDQVYLGGQLLHPRLHPPETISDQVRRVFNVNRCHAYGLRGRFLPQAYRHLCRYLALGEQHQSREGTPKAKNPAFHVDHWWGELHEAREVKVYAPQQWLVGQAQGKSTICDLSLDQRTWGTVAGPISSTPDLPERRVLVVGHPRSGTKYTAHLLQKCGLDVHHERLGADGMVSWMAATDLNERPPFGDRTTRRDASWQTCILVVRHPLNVLASAVHTENTNAKSWAFRLQAVRRVRRINEAANKYAQAVEVLLGWDQLAQLAGVNHVVRVEDAADTLPSLLGVDPPVSPPASTTNHRDHQPLTWPELEPYLTPALAAELRSYADRLGYDLVEKRRTAQPPRLAEPTELPTMLDNSSPIAHLAGRYAGRDALLICGGELNVSPNWIEQRRQAGDVVVVLDQPDPPPADVWIGVDPPQASADYLANADRLKIAPQRIELPYLNAHAYCHDDDWLNERTNAPDNEEKWDNRSGFAARAALVDAVRLLAYMGVETIRVAGANGHPNAQGKHRKQLLKRAWARVTQLASVIGVNVIDVDSPPTENDAQQAAEDSLPTAAVEANPWPDWTEPLRDLHAGRTAILVCGGPSWGNIDPESIRRSGHLLVMCNKTPSVYGQDLVPDIHVSVNHPRKFPKWVYVDPNVLSLVYSKHRTKHGVKFHSGEWFMTEQMFAPGNTEDWDNTKNHGAGSVFCCALRLLRIMGVSKVLLLGCDFTMSETYQYANGRTEGANHAKHNNSLYRYMAKRLAKLAPLMKGFEVVNVNPESHLTVWPRVSPESVGLERKEQPLPEDAQWIEEAETVPSHQCDDSSHQSVKDCRRAIASRNYKPSDDLDDLPCVYARLKLSIIRLRRGKYQEETWQRFQADVHENLDEICETLNSRWLVSILDTYVDYAEPYEAAMALAVVAMITADRFHAAADGLQNKRGAFAPLWDGLTVMGTGPRADAHRNLFRRFHKHLKQTSEVGQIATTLWNRAENSDRWSVSRLDAVSKRDVRGDVRKALGDTVPAPSPVPADPPVWTYWEGPKPDWINLCHETLLTHHPNARIVGPDDLSELSVLNDFNLSKLLPCQRADIIRLALLHHHGGLWVDSDMIVLRPLTWFLEQLNRLEFIGYQTRKKPVHYNNALMAARIGSHPVMDWMKRQQDLLAKRENPKYRSSIGPRLMTAVMRKAKNALTIPSDLVQPVPLSRVGRLVSRNADEVSMCSGAWTYHLGYGFPLSRWPRKKLLNSETFASRLFQLALDRNFADQSHAEYVEQRQLMLCRLHHQESGNWPGKTITRHKKAITSFVREVQPSSILDYGCGKGTQYTKKKIHEPWGLMPACYDPAVPEFSDEPQPADLVLCIDVMEHIDESAVDRTLDKILSLAKKAVYFSIATRDAHARLATGESAHCTIKPAEWWLEKIQKRASVLVRVSFDNKETHDVNT